jgi:LysR family transcriptional regulator, regulator for bpeEF and oprC
VHVAYPANRHLTHKVRVFIDWLIEVFRTETSGAP